MKNGENRGNGSESIVVLCKRLLIFCHRPSFPERFLKKCVSVFTKTYLVCWYAYDKLGVISYLNFESNQVAEH